MDRPELAIVIPAYNEEATISTVISDIRKYGLPVVVNDASTDQTFTAAKSAGAEVVTHKKNLGYDKALDSGFKKAHELGCKYVITMDADGQHDASMIRGFLNLLRENNDVVIGIRDRRQRFSEHLFAFVTKYFYNIQDPLCGMKGYRMHVYEKLGHFDSYGSIGTELAIFAARKNFIISQLKVLTKDRVGKPRFGSILKSNYVILKAMILMFIKS